MSCFLLATLRTLARIPCNPGLVCFRFFQPSNACFDLLHGVVRRTSFGCSSISCSWLRSVQCRLSSHCRCCSRWIHCRWSSSKNHLQEIVRVHSTEYQSDCLRGSLTGIGIVIGIAGWLAASIVGISLCDAKYRGD